MAILSPVMAEIGKHLPEETNAAKTESGIAIGRRCERRPFLWKGNTMAINRANVAVQIMEHLCECPAHGYSQPGRYGTSGFCTVSTDAGSINVKRGDRDCSSAVCEAWELALAGTDWEGAVTRYNTTWEITPISE